MRAAFGGALGHGGLAPGAAWAGGGRGDFGFGVWDFGFGCGFGCGFEGAGVPGAGALDGLDEGLELGAVDEGEWEVLGEVVGLLGEAAGGDEDASGGLLAGDDAVELACGFDADLLGLPVLALDEGGPPEVGRVAAVEDEVDAAVGLCGAVGLAGVGDAVALPAEGLGEELFKLAP